MTNESAWAIMKSYFTEGKEARTIGYLSAVNDAAILFTRLHHLFVDCEKQLEAFNADNELGEALMNKKDIDELKKALTGDIK